MTEEEWLTATNSESAIGFLTGNVSDRKLRLFGVQCCWLCEHIRKDPASCNRLEVLERFADGQATDVELQAVYDGAWKLACQYTSIGPESPVFPSAEWDEQMEEGRAFEVVGYLAARPDPQESFVSILGMAIANLEELANFEYELRPLLHDICGNPFRPVTFSPSWRTDTALSLARTMYDSRDFSAMPILADALQDAGCDNDDILSHCRDPQQAHVRGCWVVDLLLGKA